MTCESTCPRCGAMLTSGGCLSCGYPAGSLRERTAADTTLAEKSKGEAQLGHVRIEALIESFENLAYVRQQLADTRQQLEETKWECRNLEAERDEARRELAAHIEQRRTLSLDELVYGTRAMHEVVDLRVERDRLKGELADARAKGMREAAEIARNLRPNSACTCGNYLSFHNGVPGHQPGCLVGECIDIADEIEGRADEIDRSNRA